MQVVKYHTNLANYFNTQPLFFDGENQKQPNVRKCIEQPWQQTKAELWDEVTETLCNLDFIQAKACAKQTYDLVEDFNLVLEVLPENQENIEKERKRQRQLNLYKKNCVDNFKKEYNEIEIIQSIEIKRKANYWLTNSNFKKLNFRLDLLQIYGRFIRNNVYNLTKYCDIKSYVLQLAYNQENQALRKFIEKDKNKLIHNGNLFLQLERSPDYDKNFYQIEAKIYGPNTGSKTYRPHINNFFVDVANQNIFISAVNKFQKWDFKNSGLSKEFNSFDTYITAMAFNLNSNIGFFSTGAPKDRVKKICLYDIEKEECIFSSNEHNENILKVALTEDARYGYSQGYKKIIIWDFKSKLNPVVKELSLNIIGAGKQKIIFLNNFEILFWEKGDLIFFDLDKDIVLDKIAVELIDTVNYAIYSTPDRRKILIHSDNLVYFVDRIAKKIEIINVNKSSIHYDLKITADGQKIFMFGDENIYLFEIGKDLKPFIIYSHDNRIVQFEISTDAKYGFILGEAENYIEIINFEEHEVLFQKTNLDYDICFNKRFGNGEYRLIVKNKTLKIIKNESTIREILFSNYATNDNVTFDVSQNGRYLALAVSDAKVNLYDVKSDNNRLTSVPNESDITSVCISPDCKSLASVSFSRELMIFKLPNCLLLKKIKIKKYGVSDLLPRIFIFGR